MNTIFLGVIAICFLFFVIVVWYFLNSIKRSVDNMKENFISFAMSLEKKVESIENSLNPTFDELPKTLSNVRNFVEGLTEITHDIKIFTESLSVLGYNIKAISSSIERISSISAKQVSGFKAGLEAFYNVLSRHYMNKWSKKQS